ncbi:lecithin retinol acyltransferase family protein [Aeromonas media]|uniref:lecithin retinol acyltransferase family protein n=1 Tax=Aeromonas media TaxID=651 RepID=UPI001925128C|nr:lecithin retinol acyltransferase family protein [Aeromonas media]MBL0511818.1 lecithin retinol acyltransferase family protein [Aeromonas media]
MEKGDHLVSPRLGYDHHGLYLGNNSVIHYSGFSDAFDKGSIQITSLKNFEQGNGSRVERHSFPIYDTEKRIERARSKLGEDSYNLLFNNCEHFVYWCIYGVSSSPQVNNKIVHPNLTNTFNPTATSLATATLVAITPVAGPVVAVAAVGAGVYYGVKSLLNWMSD